VVRHGGLAGFFVVGFAREVDRISGGRGQQELPAADLDDVQATTCLQATTMRLHGGTSQTTPDPALAGPGRRS